MHLLLSLVLAFQVSSDTLLTRFAGQWSGTDRVKSKDGTCREFGRSVVTR